MRCSTALSTNIRIFTPINKPLLTGGVELAQLFARAAQWLAQATNPSRRCHVRLPLDALHAADRRLITRVRGVVAWECGRQR